MAERYLGMPFDIHGGGADLIFPHHENEIAQSEAAAGTEPFARFWLHNGHVQIQGEKMSKSLKNYVLVEEVLADYGPQVLRLFFSAAHYRSQVAYSPEGLDEARAVWDRFRAFLRAAPDRDVGGTQDKLAGFGAAMDDDLNTPLALSELHGLVTEGNKALEAGDTDGAAAARAAVVRGLSVLGVEPEDGAPGSDLVAPLVEWLLAEREQARADKDFDRADVIRDRLHGLGVRVEDSPQGPRWHLG
jgi:cysteinyl-tRNA synthetase